LDDESSRGNARLERRIRRLEATLEQVERIRDANATLLSRLMDDLEVERQRSHELLLNVLPERIVARLDAGETHIADRHDEAVVLMTDLVAFTSSAGFLFVPLLISKIARVFVVLSIIMPIWAISAAAPRSNSFCCRKPG